jgi:hypothetical protein
MTETDKRAAMLAALGAWIRQRPGLEFGNYGDGASYRAELRGIARDKRDAETLLRAVGLSSIGADTLGEAFERAYSGRLSWDGKRLSYCEGQYWPTEYRKAACAVLASALWRHRAADYAPGEGLKIRAAFRREYGRGLAGRWFS